MSIKIKILILAISSVVTLSAQEFTRYVNPFIGTATSDYIIDGLVTNYALGHTYPGAVMPWGMVSNSPHTGNISLKNSQKTASVIGNAGYVYGDSLLFGFGQVQVSGVGCPLFGNFAIMPTRGKLNVDYVENASTYTNQRAEPGYYSVSLPKYELNVQLTATERTTLTKIESNRNFNDTLNVVLDMFNSLQHSKDAYLEFDSPYQLKGWSKVGNFCNTPGERIIYFYAEYSKVPVSFGTYNGTKISNAKLTKGYNSGAWLRFATSNSEPVYVKFGISFVSIQNAKLNLNKEQNGFDFETTKQAAKSAWNQTLSRIKVKSKSEADLTTFYTALYHCLLHPNIINDVNGEYPSYQQPNKSNFLSSTQKHQYSTFSLWDTYRNLHSLLTLVYPERQIDMVNSMLNMYKDSGWLPKWESAGNESLVMVGDPASAVIAETYLKGLRNFDTKTAWEAMYKSFSTTDNNFLRPGNDIYRKYGFIPNNYDTKTTHDFTKVWGSVATSLEYYYADWAIGQFAKANGYKNEFKLLKRQSMNYAKFYDHTTTFLRPRNSDNTWFEPFNADTLKGSIPGMSWESGGRGYVEGNAWQYNFMIQHDIAGLVKIMGKKTFENKLTQSFQKPNRFVLFNEPDMHYPYLYNYTDKPELASKTVNDCMRKYFSNSPGGLPGNDDAGVISCWYVFSALGMYPVSPASTQYELIKAAFQSIDIELNPYFYSGKSIHIQSAHSTRENAFKWNGKLIKKAMISHESLTKGGSLIHYSKF